MGCERLCHPAGGGPESERQHPVPGSSSRVCGRSGSHARAAENSALNIKHRIPSTPTRGRRLTSPVPGLARDQCCCNLDRYGSGAVWLGQNHTNLDTSRGSGYPRRFDAVFAAIICNLARHAVYPDAAESDTSYPLWAVQEPTNFTSGKRKNSQGRRNLVAYSREVAKLEVLEAGNPAAYSTGRYTAEHNLGLLRGHFDLSTI